MALDTLEDYIELIYKTHIHLSEYVDKFDSDFFDNVHRYIMRNKPLSTKQVSLAKKLCIKYKGLIADRANTTKEDIERTIPSIPTRKLPYQSVDYPREIRYVGNRRVAIRSKRIPKLQNKIKQLKQVSTKPEDIKLVDNIIFFNRRYSLWVIEVLESNLEAIYTTIKQVGIDVDDQTLDFFAKCENSKTKKSTAYIEDGNIVLEIQNNDFLSEWFDKLLYCEVIHVPKS